MSAAEPPRLLRGLLLLACGLLPAGCPGPNPETAPPEPPRGYVDRLWFSADGTRVAFGPFVGYSFKPPDPDNLRELEFLCHNEGQFYTRDLPANALLYRGTAIRSTLPDEGEIPSGDARILPVFFPDAPESWKRSRPEPRDEFLHFHSAHSEAGAVRTGYWLRHVAVAAFTYDMGGRVTEQSPLHHRVTPGVDTSFARIIEFDHGP